MTQRFWAASLVAAALLAGAAQAQTAPAPDAPIGDAPIGDAPIGDAPSPPPLDTAPSGPVSLTPPAPLPSETASQPSSIESSALQRLDGWSVSALSRDQGALDPALWRGTDPAALAALLARLPANYASPAVQALAVRVLASGGEAPAGESQDAMRKRFEALGKAGFADLVSTLATGAGESAADPAIAQFAAQAELGRGRRSEACARGRSASTDAPSTFLLRLRAYCAAAGGDRAAADLALALIQGGGADQAWFANASAAAAGAPPARPIAARYDTTLNAALSLAAHLRPGPNPLAGASNMALLAVARTETSPQPIRAQAAALAFRRGILSAAEARAILRATPSTATAGVPAIAAAVLQVETAPGTLAAASAIAGVLQQATAPADFTAAARFFKDDIANLQAAPNVGAAYAFARAALAAGDSDLSARLTMAARQAGVSETALGPLEAALSLARGDRGDAATLAVQRRIHAGGAAGLASAMRDVAILVAMGTPINGQMQADLIANPPQAGAAADASALASLHAAAERGSVGETGLWAVVAAGDGPARLNAGSVAQIIHDLCAVGLVDQARALAIEAILAGPPRTAAAAPTPAAALAQTPAATSAH